MNALNKRGLELTEEEAYALLSLCITSPVQADEDGMTAIKKLAEYCSQRRDHSNHQEIHIRAAVV